LSRSDRLAKYNQLLHTEQLPGKNAVYAGTSALPKGEGKRAESSHRGMPDFWKSVDKTGCVSHNQSINHQDT